MFGAESRAPEQINGAEAAAFMHQGFDPGGVKLSWTQHLQP